MYSKSLVPINFTAAPSAMVLTDGKFTGFPSATAAFALAAPSGSTPMIFTCGFFSFAAAATPEINPPPPTGTKIISAFGNSSRISKAIVPCPSITSSSSKGWTNT